MKRRKSLETGLWSVFFLWWFDEEGRGQWQEHSYGRKFEVAMAWATRLAEENPGLLTKVE